MYKLLKKFSKFSVIQWKNFGFNGAHSQSVTEILPKMKIKLLPALSDNYMYLVSSFILNIYVNFK